MKVNCYRQSFSGLYYCLYRIRGKSVDRINFFNNNISVDLFYLTTDKEAFFKGTSKIELISEKDFLKEWNSVIDLLVNLGKVNDSDVTTPLDFDDGNQQGVFNFLKL